MELRRYLFILLASAGVIACGKAPTSPVGPTGAPASPDAASMAAGSSTSTQHIGVMHADNRDDDPDEDNTIIITDSGLRPQNLQIDEPGTVTFINRSTTTRWIRSHPHMPGGHNTCPGEHGLDVFEQIGVLAPGQSGRTGVIILQSCDYHDHLLKDPGIFQGRVTVEEDFVRTPPLPPAPSYTVTLAASPSSLVVNNSATLTATVTAVNGAPPPTSYAWDCTNNGTVDATTAINTTSCAYTSAGTITSRVTVSSATASGSATTTVTVTAVTPPTVTYVNNVKAILDTRCTACHNGDGQNAPPGLDFRTYAGVSVVTSGGANSPLVLQTGPGGGMVLRSGITPAEAEVIRQWVVVFGAPQQ